MVDDFESSRFLGLGTWDHKAVARVTVCRSVRLEKRGRGQRLCARYGSVLKVDLQNKARWQTGPGVRFASGGPVQRHRLGTRVYVVLNL